MISGIDPGRVPRHVAIVMDGNGRWAQQRGLKRTDGHAAGEEALFDTVEGALELGVKWMTVYAFSTENWRRPIDEVRFLMRFNESLLLRRRDDLDERGVRVRFIGRRGGRVPKRVLRHIEDTEALTAKNRRMTLTFAFNYGGRAELTDAVRSIGREVAARRLAADDISEKTIARHLYAPDMPDPDLMVRTSGEYRISNYLLWESAYSEFVFTDVLWPDFRSEHLFDAVPEYQLRATDASAAWTAPDPNRFVELAPECRSCASIRAADVRPAVRRLDAMPGLYHDQGVVLRTIKLGEADRIVSFMTQGNGKVRAVAKGVRKSGSRFGARLEPASHLILQCYRGRELDVVTQVETIDAFRPLRENYAALTHAVSMLEAVDQVAQEREPAPAMYRMLVGALRTMSESPSPVVTPGFFWKLLSLEGFHPHLDGCVRCGDETGPFPAFDLADGGVLCAACGRLGGRRIEPEALEFLGRLVGGELHRAMADPPDVAHVHEVERLAIAALEYHSERRLRSASLL